MAQEGNTTMEKNRKGMIFGSFMGDALALGPHWVYNTNVIDKKFGRIQQYLDPLTSYHAGKKKGDFTHYGDQMLMLLEFLATVRVFDPKQFGEAWKFFFNDYEGYRDKATLTTLRNMTEGGNPAGSGSLSDELGGAARIAPVVYAYFRDPESAIQTARQQTALTHNNLAVLEAAGFFSKLALGVLAGEKPSSVIPDLLKDRFQYTNIADTVSLGLTSQEKDTRTAIKAFGQMCSIEAALPGTIHLIAKYENDFEEALVENVMAGGDSAARGMLAGMVLGAYAGIDALPRDWMDTLNARDRIDELLAVIDTKPL